MSLRVYNSLSRQKELFEPVRPGKVGMYLCGPTVYKSPHIGHMVGPVIFDAIKRYLRNKGFDVTLIVNITDVEDKLIDASVKTGTPVAELAAKYSAEYHECLSLLGIDTIDRFPKASDHIGEIIQLCTQLIEKNHAYVADGNVYFDVLSDPDYGKLSHRKVEEQESGLRDLEGGGKRNPADFALWKAAKPGEPTTWDSPWGKGRPGWHIECSAMSMKYLGETFDLHGGGLDLLFPHHENELAQSESATGKTFARYWLHNGLTRMKTKMASGEWQDQKMSGSLGNVVSARQLIDRHGADLLRYMLLSTHYRRPIEFTDEVISNAKKGLSVFPRLIERVERILGAPLAESAPCMDQVAAGLLETELGAFAKPILDLKMKFLEMMDDDFNTAGAIAVMHELAGQINGFTEKNQVEKSKQPEMLSATTAATCTLRKLGLLLGLFRKSAATASRQQPALTDDLMKLFIKLRADARQSKNFALADAIRNGLTEIGVTLEDRSDGTIWRKD
ncbi:MAG TPA: cysteine--tRNA ligase [Tepidisphaeraceae bacterium]|jgi:cysteinyl-tRNA synthetase|nr:cysteine--tRNA ligase [Tepidisphaeraceae bacterium]